MVSDTVYNDIISIIESDLREINLDCIGSEMLLLALVGLKDSMTSLIFKEMGVTTKQIKDEIINSYFLRKESVYTSKFYEIVKKSNDLMDENEYVYDEAYLYSLLIINDTVAKDILQRLGLDEKIILDELNNAREFLEKDSRILVNMTRLAREGKLNPFIGRVNYIDKIDRILSKKQKNNPMLIGAAGVGKTGLVEGLAQFYVKNNPKLILYRLDLGAIIAGTRYRGDLEERLIDAIEDIKADNAIVFIDEIHNILSSNYNEASLDIANILKPVLSRNEIKCIGATTTEEYYKYIYKDKALVRRFQNIFVEEVTDEECFEILKGIKVDYESFYNITYSDEVLKYIIEVTKLIINRKQPDKAIDILDESGLMASRKKDSEVSDDTIIHLIFENIGINRSECLNKLQKDLNYKNLRDYYHKYLLMKTKNNILNVQCTKKDTIIEDLKIIFNIKDEMILDIDLADYVDKHYASNLIGSPSGYVGYDNGGLLTEHLLKHPFAVICFKNYNQSGYLIKGIIKRAIENGVIIDSKSRNISLHNTIFIFEHKNSETKLGFITENNQSKIDDFIDEVI